LVERAGRLIKVLSLSSMSYRARAMTRQCSAYNIHISNLTLTFYNYLPHFRTKPIPGAARSKVWVCGCSFAGSAGSNPTRGMDVFCECCVLEVSATGPSLVQRSPTDCVRASECDREASKMRRPWPTRRDCATEGGGGEEGCGGEKLPRLNV